MEKPSTLPPSNRVGRGHLMFLDGFRGLAALYVMLHHAYLRAWPINSNLNMLPIGVVPHVMHWLVYGRYAVTLFIMISGFSLMIPVQRHGGFRGGMRGFYLGRVRRILPPYYTAIVFSVLLSLVVSWILHDPASVPTAHSVILHFLLLHNFFGETTSLNGPMWSIAVEFQIYIFFPLMVLAWRRFGVFYALGVSVMLFVAFGKSLGFGLFPAHYFLIFGFGLLASTLAFNPKPNKWVVPAARILCGVMLSFAAYWIWHHGAADPWQQDVLLGIAGACLMLIASLRPEGVLRRGAERRPLTFVGAFSYSLYLIHDPLQALLSAIFSRMHLTPVAVFGLLTTIGSAVILSISYWFFRWFEFPFMKSKPTV